MSAFGSIFSNLATSGFPGVFFDIYTGVLGLGFVVALYVYIRRRPLSRGITPRRHFLRRTAEAVMWISGVGLFFSLMRYVELTFVDMRFYSYLVVLLAVAYAGNVTYFLSERYPLQRYQFEQVAANRRYTGASGRRPSAAVAAPARSGIQRGKRRR